MKKIFLVASLLFLVLGANAQYQLPKLNYTYGDLEPYIDAKTMDIHYNKHHAAYIKNVNTFFDKHPSYKGKSVVELIENINSLPATDQNLVRNNGGGHYNHTLFWSMMTPASKSQAKGAAVDAIIKKWGSLDKFKEEFKQAAIGRFGSGWVWLVVDNNGALQIGSTPNQDSPIMDVSTFKGKPVLGLDVWEHAYYLKHQSARADYVDAFWNVVNWGEVNRLYQSALK